MRNRKHWVVLLLAIVALSLSGCDLFDDEDCDEVSTDDGSAWVDLVDGNEYNMRYSCESRPLVSVPFCPYYQQVDLLTMDYLGDGEWQGVVDLVEEEDQLVVTGTFDGTDFEWSTDIDGITVTGTWFFSEDGETFGGNAFGTEAGDEYQCLMNGVLDPDEPPPVEDFGTCSAT